MAERRLKVGVVGVGYLGSFHAEKYASLSEAELVGVYDVDQARAREVAAANGCRALSTVDELLAGVEAVSIAVPTVDHLEVGRAAARAAVHMLVEKPLAADAAAGRELVAAASEAGVLLQVGHLERFNPVFDELRTIVSEPRFIECHRLSQFAGRGSDTNVVYDVMIHDLDLIDFVVGHELIDAEAIGVPVLSGHFDIANARLRFAGGCIANVTASRVSLKRERKLRIFQPDAYVSIDFDERRVLVARRGDTGKAPDPASPMEGIEVEERAFEGADPLREQIGDFVACVTTGETPRVGGGEGLQALVLAEKVLAAIDKNEAL